MEFMAASKLRRIMKKVGSGLDVFSRRASNDEILVQCELAQDSRSGALLLCVVCTVLIVEYMFFFV
jgi:hypothetical protein